MSDTKIRISIIEKCKKDVPDNNCSKCTCNEIECVQDLLDTIKMEAGVDDGQ